MIQFQTGDGQSSRHELTGRLPLVWCGGVSGGGRGGGRDGDLWGLQHPGGDARFFEMCTAQYLQTNAQEHSHPHLCMHTLARVHSSFRKCLMSAHTTYWHTQRNSVRLKRRTWYWKVDGSNPPQKVEQSSGWWVSTASLEDKSLKKGTKSCRTVVLPGRVQLTCSLGSLLWIKKYALVSFSGEIKHTHTHTQTHTHTHSNIRLIMSHFPFVSSKLTFLQPTVPLNTSKSLSVCTSWCGCIHRYTLFGRLTIYRLKHS